MAEAIFDRSRKNGQTRKSLFERNLPHRLFRPDHEIMECCFELQRQIGALCFQRIQGWRNGIGIRLFIRGIPPPHQGKHFKLFLVP